MSKNNTAESEELTDAMYYILLALMEERHGYAIMKYVEELTQGRVMIGPGTLYTLLKKLVKIEWIKQLEGNERQKLYVITTKGKHILVHDWERRSAMVEDGRLLIGGGSNGK